MPESRPPAAVAADAKARLAFAAAREDDPEEERRGSLDLESVSITSAVVTLGTARVFDSSVVNARFSTSVLAKLVRRYCAAGSRVLLIHCRPPATQDVDLPVMHAMTHSFSCV